MPSAFRSRRRLAQPPLHFPACEKPPRLDQIFSSYDPPLWFVTFNTHARRHLLATDRVHARFVDFARAGESRNIDVGRYVLMPDHVHLFVRGGPEFSLSQWVRLLKRELSKVIIGEPRHWQPGFFDHLIRRSESYGEKWEYVRQNPVRAGLVADADAWPFQGEIVRLEM